MRNTGNLEESISNKWNTEGCKSNHAYPRQGGARVNNHAYPRQRDARITMLTLDKSRLHIKPVLKRKQGGLLYNGQGTSQQEK